MGKRLGRFGEVRIIDETNGFGPMFCSEHRNDCPLYIRLRCISVRINNLGRGDWYWSMIMIIIIMQFIYG